MLFRSGMFVLFILHHLLNWKWYSTLHKGKYTPARIFQVTINMLTCIAMVGLMISSVLLSNYVFSFLGIYGYAAFGRKLHMLTAYWGFVLMAMHIGLHWNSVIALLKKQNPNGLKKWQVSCMRIVAGAIVVYGGYAFWKHNLLAYMFLRTQFVFFDLSAPLVYFFIEYIAIMGLWACVGYYSKLGLIKVTKRKKG